MKQNDIFTIDMNKISLFPQKVIDALVDNICYYISDNISKAKLSGQKTTSISIGIGKLCVDFTTGKLKFIPSAKLKDTINISQGQSNLLDKKLSDDIMQQLLDLCNNVI